MYLPDLSPYPRSPLLPNCDAGLKDISIYRTYQFQNAAHCTWLPMHCHIEINFLGQHLVLQCIDSGGSNRTSFCIASPVESEIVPKIQILNQKVSYHSHFCFVTVGMTSPLFADRLIPTQYCLSTPPLVVTFDHVSVCNAISLLTICL